MRVYFIYFVFFTFRVVLVPVENLLKGCFGFPVHFSTYVNTERIMPVKTCV